MSSDGEKYLHFLVTKAHAVKFVDNIMSFHVFLIHRITTMLGVAKNLVTEDLINLFIFMREPYSPSLSTASV